MKISVTFFTKLRKIIVQVLKWWGSSVTTESDSVWRSYSFPGSDMIRFAGTIQGEGDRVLVGDWPACFVGCDDGRQTSLPSEVISAIGFVCRAAVHMPRHFCIAADSCVKHGHVFSKSFLSLASLFLKSLVFAGEGFRGFRGSRSFVLSNLEDVCRRRRKLPGITRITAFRGGSIDDVIQQ